MGATSLTGDDVIQINGRQLVDLGPGESVKIDFEEDLANVKASKNGNTVFAKNEAGRVSVVTVRLLLGSADDKYMNSLIADMNADFSTQVLLTGYLSKRIGDGEGQLSGVKVYNCRAGVIKRNPSARVSADGDVEQSVAEYMIKFGNTQLSIQ